MAKNIKSVFALGVAVIAVIFVTSLSVWSLEHDLYLSTEIVGSERVYEVRKGDTLHKIAAANGVPISLITSANSISNRGHIFPGQQLILSDKKIVPNALYEGVVINLPEFSLYVFKDGALTDIFPITIGKRNWHTPTGIFAIKIKARNPSWQVPPGMVKRLGMKQRVVPPGPNNPLGDVWVGLDLPHIGIHGTNKPSSIGKALSHGCMRLKPKDARTFFKSIEVGMQGEIIYEPIKIAIKGNIVLMEVHEDVYGKVPDMYRHALKMIYALDLVDKVDLQRVKNTVEYKSGVPEIISPVDNNASSTAKLESLRPGGNLGFD